MDDSLLGAELEDDEATAVMEDPNDPAGAPEEASVGSEAEETAAEASSGEEALQSPDAASEDAEEDAAERGPGPGADLSDEQLEERTLALLFASPDPLSVGRLVNLLERPPAAASGRPSRPSATASSPPGCPCSSGGSAAATRS